MLELRLAIGELRLRRLVRGNRPIEWPVWDEVTYQRSAAEVAGTATERPRALPARAMATLADDHIAGAHLEAHGTFHRLGEECHLCAHEIPFLQIFVRGGWGWARVKCRISRIRYFLDLGLEKPATPTHPNHAIPVFAAKFDARRPGPRR